MNRELIRFDDWKNNPKNIINIFMLIPTSKSRHWMSFVGNLFSGCYTKLVLRSWKPSTATLLLKFIARQTRWVAKRKIPSHLNRSTWSLAFFYFISMEVDNLRIECKSTEKHRKEKHFYTQFLCCLFWTVGVENELFLLFFV